MNKICPKCQTENISTAKFCRKCGSLLGTAQSTDVVPSKELSDIDKRVAEEKLYEQVAIDVKNGIRREGLYAKALVDANGSTELAHTLYIKYAVQSLQDELTLQVKITEAAERALHEKMLQIIAQSEKKKKQEEDELKLIIEQRDKKLSEFLNKNNMEFNKRISDNKVKANVIGSVYDSYLEYDNAEWKIVNRILYSDD